MKHSEKWIGRIETETLEGLEQIATAQHRTMASVVRQALAEWLKERRSARVKANS